MSPRRIRVVYPFALLLALAYSGTSHAQVQRTGALDEADLVVLHGNTHPLARAEFDRGPVSESLELSQMILVLHGSPEQEAELKTLMAEQQDPSSPNYHRWLTPTEFGARFGASLEDIAAITSWLKSHGFRIDNVSKGRRQIQFTGTAGQVRETFRTSIHKLSVKGESHYANVSDPAIPRAFTPVVSGIASLHDFRSKPMHHVVGAAKRSNAADASAPNFTFSCTVLNQPETCHGVGPWDFATIYNVLPLWTTAPTAIDGTDQTIAIVQRSNIPLTDVSDFRSLFGLAPKAPVVTITNSDPGLVPNDETEALLDVEWSGAVAKNATINMVTSTSGATDGVVLSAQYIVDNNVAPVVSMSYSYCEAGLGQAGNEQMAALWSQASAQGQTVFVSTGDSGSAGCDDPNGGNPAQFGLQVNGIASTPYNVGVGGTDFLDAFSNSPQYWNTTNDTNEASARSYIPETPWNSSCANMFLSKVPYLSSAGFPFSTSASANCNSVAGFDLGIEAPVGGSGGKSNCGIWSSATSCSGYPKPSWQVAPGVPPDHVRDLPDVSLFASSGIPFLNAYVMCEADQQGGPCTASTFFLIGGTSASSPAMAGIMALVNQATATIQGNANYVFYRMGAAQSSVTCNSSSTKGPASSCVFNDVTQGNNVEPCQAGTLNCVGSGAAGVGLLPGYSATAGYDLATGLGTVNAANLVNAWPKDSIQFSAPAYSVSETGLKATIGVTRTGSSLESIAANWTVEGVSAAFGTDYTVQSGTVTIPAGSMAGSFTIPVIHDTTTGSKVAVIALTDPAGPALPAPPGLPSLGSPSEAVLTITNVDNGGTVQFSPTAATVAVGGTVTLHVTRTGVTLASNVTVPYSTADGSARAGTDYTGATGTLTFLAGQPSATITIATIPHGVVEEPNLGFTVGLGAATGGATTGLHNTASVTITEPGTTAVKFSMSAYMTSEHMTQAVVTVLRTGDMTGPAILGVVCTSPNAVSPTNYTCPSNVTVPAMKSSGTFTVAIAHDNVYTGNLTVNMALQDPPTAYVASPSTATLTIVDIDAPAVISFASPTASYTMGTSPAYLNLTVKRAGGAPNGVVSFQTNDITATGGTDYFTNSGTLTFLGTDTSLPLQVSFPSSAPLSPNESFSVTLSNPTAGAKLGTLTKMIVTIVKNDAGLEFSMPTYSTVETMKTATIIVKKVGNMSQSVSASVACSSTNATSANYSCPANPVPVSIPAGLSMFPFPITLLHDGVHTGNLSVNLALQSPTNAYLGSPSNAVLKITDVDPAALLSLSEPTYSVNETAGSETIGVRRSGLMTGQVTVNYATSPGSALPGTNYTTTTGTLTFQGTGDNLQSFSVPIINGGESKVSFGVQLSAPGGTNAALGVFASAVVNINDTDTDGAVQFQSPTTAVSQTAGTAVLQVTRSTSTGAGSVAYQTTDGTAASGTDYTGGGGTVTFGVGVKSQTISIPITDHSPTTGTPRYFTVTLGSPSPGIDIGTLSTQVVWIDEEQTE